VEAPWRHGARWRGWGPGLRYAPAPMRYRIGDHVLDTSTLQLLAGATEVDLEPQAFAVLAHLVTHRDRVVAKEELLDEVWGSRFVSESALTTRIKQIRRALGDTGQAQDVVRTHRGRGYRMVADVEELDGPAPTPAPAPAATAPPPVPPTRYAEGDGASIAYQTYGEGPDLVLVSGFATNVEVQWEHPAIAAFLTRLGGFARVTVWDKRGVGLSDRVPHDSVPSLETRADDLLAVLDAAGVRRASLLGSSEGGSLAAVFAATHPDRVDRLVLHDTWVTGPDFPRAGRSDLDLVLERWGTGRIYRYLAPGLAAGPEGLERVARLERQSATPRTARHLLELIARVDIAGILAAVTVPTLVLHRAEDPVVPLTHAEALAAGIPGARLQVLEGRDHHLCSGDTGELLAAVEAFVTGTEAPDRDPERVLATVVVLGAAGTAEDGRAAADLLRRVAAEVVARHRGDAASGTAGEVLATFDGPGRAVRAASEILQAAGAAGLTAHAGVHTTEVERHDDGSITGTGVELARQIAAAARPGEVWVSRTVTDLVAGTGLVFEPRGEHVLTGVEVPWMLHAATGRSAP
jgi:pimeloyl-ACP methyl ester carboxylesterase/DNA-binding winged helix-turn-helix (wHTH) protein/class 3 adenylate cyclase